MKKVFNILRHIVSAIALLVFLAGIIISIIGMYEFAITFSHIATAEKHHMPELIATGLLKSIDLFLMAIVFFVFSLGVLILFTASDQELPVQLPTWLRIKNFMELKIILWEAILTTLVISYLANLAEKRMAGEQATLETLLIPGAIFLISLSLYFLKKEKH